MVAWKETFKLTLAGMGIYLTSWYSWSQGFHFDFSSYPKILTFVANLNYILG